MLHFVIGRVGSGKTVCVRELLASFVAGGFSDMTLIVPEQFSFETERDMLNRLGASNASAVEVMSFSRLAERLLSQFGGIAGKALDDGARTVLMSRAAQTVSEQLELYSKASRSPGLIGELLALSSELKRCAVSPEALLRASNAMDDCILKRKATELSLILQAYDALVAQSFRDDKNSLGKLYDLLLREKPFEGKIVVIDAFHGFTAEEYKIIERILVQSKSTYITLCTDSLFQNGCETDAFAHTRRTASRLLDIAKRSNVRTAKVLDLSGPSKFCNFPTKFPRYKNEPLAALESLLCGKAQGKYTFPATEITVCSAEDVGAECAFVAHNIKRLMRGGMRCRDIAVIARDAGSCEAQLKSAFVKCGIPIFEDKRQPIKYQPLIVLACAACEIAASGFQAEPLMKYLKSGLAGLSVEETAELENYSLVWKINGSAWLTEFTGHPNGFGNALDEDAVSALERLNALRERAVAPLARLREQLSGSVSGLHAASALFTLLTELDIKASLKLYSERLSDAGETALAEEQERIWDCLVDVLDSLALSLGDTRVDARGFFDLFMLVVGAQSLGNIPRGLDEVTIGSADRIRIGSPRAVFVVGLNDGIFPRNPSEDGILDGNDRRRLGTLGLELSDGVEYTFAEERFIAYTSLCCASELVFLSYPRKNASGASLSPSPLISEVTDFFPHCTLADTEDADKERLIEGSENAFELLCSEYGSGTPLCAALEEYFDNRPDYTERMKALRRAASNDDFKIESPEVASELFGKNMYLSASRAETYHLCAFKYFCQYGLSARVRGVSEIDSRLYGSLVHFILEKLLTAHPGRELAELEPAARLEEIKALTEEYLSEYMSGAVKNKRFDYFLRRYADAIDKVVQRLAEEFSRSAFLPVDFELLIDRDGDISPYEIETRDGKIFFRGRVDRVDRMESDGKSYIRIIDYKTGGKDFSLSNVFFGLDMQMLIYLFAVWQNGSERYGNVVPAGILYFPAKPVGGSLPRNASADEVEKERAAQAAMKGLLLDSSVVISGMESDGRGKLIPAKFDKDGKPVGSVISLERLASLRDTVNRILAEMADSLHEGKIAASPLYGSSGNHDKTCEFCDFAPVCGHEKGMAIRELVKKPDGDIFNELDTKIKEEDSE